MKLAFTSSDGIMVDTHFGKAEKFYIYEIKRGGIFYRGVRKSISYSSDENQHNTDYAKLSSISKTINDCLILYTAAIGDTPRDFLQEKGMQIETTRGTISSVFLKL